MKATSSRSYAPFASRALKVVGIILVVSFVLDLITLLIPANFLSPEWQINFITQVVDRGVIPLVGISFIFVADWIDRTSGATPPQSAGQAVEFWTLLFASLLGLIYLLAVPLHLNNVRLESKQALERISEEARAAEGQIDSRLGQEVERQRSQITELVQDEQRLNEAINSGQIPQEQQSLLRQFRNDPQALNAFLDKQSEEIRTRIKTEIGTRKLAAEKQTRNQAIKSGLRTGISSLLLAAGYIFIGWTGLRNFGSR